MVPEERRPAFRRLFALLGERLGGWIVGQLISMTTIGVLAAVAFSVIGVPYALLLGVVTGVAEFPFVTIFSLLLFGGIFGFLGILLALPLVLLVWTAVQVLWVERAIGAGEDSIPPVVPE